MDYGVRDDRSPRDRASFGTRARARFRHKKKRKHASVRVTCAVHTHDTHIIEPLKPILRL